MGMSSGFFRFFRSSGLPVAAVDNDHIEVVH